MGPFPRTRCSNTTTSLWNALLTARQAAKAAKPKFGGAIRTLSSIPHPRRNDLTPVPLPLAPQSGKYQRNDLAPRRAEKTAMPPILEQLHPLRTSPLSLTFTGTTTMPITSELKIVTPNQDPPSGIWPVFRLMDEDGEFRDPNRDTAASFLPSTPAFSHHNASSEETLDAFRNFLCKSHPHLVQEFQESALLHKSDTPYSDTHSRHTLLRAHRQMMRLRHLDHFMMNAQRQGRISFYMTCTGEEGIHMGAASALDPRDPILAQYREQGLLMWRGFTLEQFTNQCYSNDRDIGKGRQMPVHYGSKALQYHTVSSPLGTQLPQAVGVAYRLKLAKQKNVSVCFFGDGCASTTDFHSAMNFAATLKAPVVFFCRNNGYAISTPVTDQYAGDGIVARAPGYGMAAIRVDGNDIFAVHAAMRQARIYALENEAPVLIEAMTYRLGHHSTSDDSSRYRSSDEVEDFKSHMDPLGRLENFLIKHGLLTSDQASQINEEERSAVREAMSKAEKRPKPPMEKLFEDVYHSLPTSLEEQQKALQEHIAKYPEKYNI